MRIEDAVLKLKSADAVERLLAAGALRDAVAAGEDIGAAEGALKGALADKDADVRASAARVLTDFYGRRKAWKEINALLADARGDVRASVFYKLAGFAGSFDIRTDIPNIIKSLDDQDFETRKEAALFFEKAAANGLDISFAIPGLKRAAAYGDERVKEAVSNAIRTSEMRKQSGGRCGTCLDCETGFGPGDASRSFEGLALIIKSISCCGGDVTHRVIRCSKCGKHYLSTYFDHSDTGHGQFSISLIGKDDAMRIAAELKKCPNPEWRLCKCEVHTGYLKDERVPVKGELKYSAKDKD
jgi:hypothetical protein